MGLFSKLFKKDAPAAPSAAPEQQIQQGAPEQQPPQAQPTQQTPPVPTSAAEQTGAPAGDQKQADEELLLTILLSTYAGSKDDESFENLLKYLCICSVWVPVTFRMSEEDQKQFMNVKKGDSISLKQFMGMKPDILGTPDGSLYFPVFSQQAQAPDEYRQKFSWIRLPFLECAHMALGFSGVHAIVINAFSHKLVANETILQALTQVKTEQQKLGNREFGPAPENEETKALQKALYNRIKWINYLEKAYLLQLSGEGEESFAVIIDDPKHKPQDLFTFIHKEVSWLRLSHPVDYVTYENVKQKVEELGCQPFYIKQGEMCIQKISLSEGHTVIIRILFDSSGEEEEYRIEVRRETESHYTFDRAGMSILKNYFQENGQNDPLEGLQAYLKPYSASPDDADTAILKLLSDLNVVFRRSQVDHKDMELLKSYISGE